MRKGLGKRLKKKESKPRGNLVDLHAMQVQSNSQSRSTFLRYGYNRYSEGLLAEDSIVDEEEQLNLDESMIQRAYKREVFEKQSKLKLASTISSYVFNSIAKKSRSFCIGVATVFLVVCFITSLKSMIDIVPIALLKVG
mmetsp:Transcript_2326/g.3980  ORF Transcript_2326/g.3980 Transcript_2326/m.3980 type:complete len:139 (+) Transcript_2326:247-663(+)